jgi:hypothetical protein
MSASGSGNQTSSPTPEVQSGFTDGALRHHSQELGLLGKIFGSKEHAPYNIAAVTILMALGMLCFMFYQGSNNAAAITLLGAIVTGGMGYVFGKSGS